MIRESELEGLSRREREKLMRRREMIIAARKIFSWKGYAESTLEDVAELAEFGKGTLYNYFPNKDALFSSVLEDIFNGFVTIFREVLGSDLEFKAKIRALLEKSLRYGFSNPEGILLLVREAHHLRENNPLMQKQPQLVEPLADTMAAEQKRNPSMLRNDPRQLAMVLLNLVIGQFMNRLHLCFQKLKEPDADSPAICQEKVVELFTSFRTENLEEEVQVATDFIYTLYFHGICSAENS